MARRSLLALAVSVAALAGCGETLIDHNGVEILKSASKCGFGQVVCDGKCTSQGGGPLEVCGTGCTPCSAPPSNATSICAPTGPDGHDGLCAFHCANGLLACVSGAHGSTVDACCEADLVAAGGEFSCATTSTGEVHCFGAGDRGQLGNNLTADRSTSAVLRGFTQPVTALAAGGAHACAISGGQTLCWGNGAAFEVSGDVLDPVPVATLAGASVIAAGKSHTCGIVGGQLRCIGTGPTAGGGSPALAGTPFAVAAGDRFTCTLVDAGAGGTEVWCWGFDDRGELGDGVAGTFSATPLLVGGGISSAVDRLAAGTHHACAGRSTDPGNDQTLWCWGDNSYKQVGIDAAATLAPPTLNTRVKKPILGLTAGDYASCAVENDPGGGGNVLSCWSSDPLVAGGAATGEPNHVAAATTPYAYSAGAVHTCFVDTFATPAVLKCFGEGARGQLGNGSTADSASPVLVVDR